MLSILTFMLTMETTRLKINPHISVDCVVFGFDGENLKVLLIKRFPDPSQNGHYDLKLPGDFITDQEDLDQAANRILSNLTGLNDVFLEQFRVFGSPDRISDTKDIEWLKRTQGLTVKRVVTIAYYSLVKIDESKVEKVQKNDGVWVDIPLGHELAFDHADIVESGLKNLRINLRYKPLGLELLPEKFPVRQLQNLYEVILGSSLDNRNFRKKVFRAGYLADTGEKETRVAHKPARLYSFNKESYHAFLDDFNGFQF